MKISCVLYTTKTNSWKWVIIFLSPIAGFRFIVFMSILFRFSSQTLFFFWLRLEINIISILPILGARDTFFRREITIKYFISQSVASIIFLVLFFLVYFFTSSSLELIFTSAVLFKLGVPPFHRWFLNIIIRCPLDSIILILFVQKFIPLHILSKIYSSFILNCLIMVLTFLLIFFYLKNLSSLRIVLVLSAWGNSLWIIVSRSVSDRWFIFLTAYGAFLFIVLWAFKFLNAPKISILLRYGINIKIMCAVRLLNLAGLPPFSGFFAKLFLIKTIINFTPLFLIFMLLNTSLLVLLSYTFLSFYFLASQSPRINSFPFPVQKFFYSSGLFIFLAFPIFNLFI